MTSFRIVGFCANSAKADCFCVPLFSDGDHSFIQVIDRDGFIMGFSPTLAHADVKTESGEPPIEAAIGDEAYYAFRVGGRVLCTKKEKLHCLLRENLFRSEELPYTRLEAAAFFNDWSQAARAARSLIERSSSDRLANAIKGYLVSNFLGQIEPSNAAFRVDSVCRTLLAFYKSYRQLLYVKDAGRRATLSRRYSTVAQRIESRIFNDGLLEIVEVASSTYQQAAQLRLPLEFDTQYKITRVLSGMGVKRRSATRLIAGAQQLLQASTESREIVDLETLHFRIATEEFGIKTLDRVERKVAKRDLDDGAFAVISGVLLLLKSEAVDVRQSTQGSQLLRLFGYSALQLGQRNRLLPVDVRLDAGDFRVNSGPIFIRGCGELD